MNQAWLLRLSLIVAAMVAGGCAAEVDRTVDGGAGGASTEGAGGEAAAGADGDTAAGAGGNGGEVPDDVRFAFCPPAPERPDGLREGTVPGGAPAEVEASAIFGRASHEVMHLVSAIRADDAGELQSLFAIEDDTIAAGRDGEAVRGTIARDAASGNVCVALAFGSWTGGHGGWGLSALDGTLELLFDADTFHARGSLGLVESGPLDGAPSAIVTVSYVAEVLSGSVGSFLF